MKQKKSRPHCPSEAQPALLEHVRVALVTAAVDAQNRWVALLLFSAAAKHLKHRAVSSVWFLIRHSSMPKNPSVSQAWFRLGFSKDNVAAMQPNSVTARI